MFSDEIESPKAEIDHPKNEGAIVQFSGAGAVCDHCAGFLESARTEDSTLSLRFRKSHHELRASVCHFCNFLGTVMAEHRERSVRNAIRPAIKLYVEQYEPRICSLRFSYSVPLGDNILYHAKMAFPSPNRYHQDPGRHTSIPYDKIKTWIQDCHSHQSCTRTVNSVVKDLRVIQCNTWPAHTVDAPETCRYVALSYVWGDLQGPSHEECNLFGNNLP